MQSTCPPETESAPECFATEQTAPSLAGPSFCAAPDLRRSNPAPSLQIPPIHAFRYPPGKGYDMKSISGQALFRSFFPVYSHRSAFRQAMAPAAMRSFTPPETNMEGTPNAPHHLRGYQTEQSELHSFAYAVSPGGGDFGTLLERAPILVDVERTRRSDQRRRVGRRRAGPRIPSLSPVSAASPRSNARR